MTAYHINSSGTVAVAIDYYWQPMETCPLGVKVQLLNPGMVAIYGVVTLSTRGQYKGWAPLPKVPDATPADDSQGELPLTTGDRP